jgi:ABC-type Zn2+ transport system substrate-binding protein/surface adhesin
MNMLIKALCLYVILLDISPVCSLKGAMMARAVEEKAPKRNRIQVRGLESIKERALNMEEEDKDEDDNYDEDEDEDEDDHEMGT